MRTVARAVLSTLVAFHGLQTMAEPRFTPQWDAALQARDADRLKQLARDAIGRLPLDAQGFSPLHRASALEAGSADAEMFRVLVDAGADIHQRGGHGMTPMHMAAADGCVPCVRILLQAGASPSTRRTDGGTPLHRARASVQAILVAAGADVRARDLLGRTPLHTAADPGDVLLAVGADTVDRHGFTPLHVAALEGATSKIEWLLAHGADPSVRSTSRHDYRAGVLAESVDPVISFEAGQRPYDLARWQYRQNRWATSRYTRAYELLDRATPRGGLFFR